MAIQIGANFSFKGKKFLDDRQSFDTLAEMKSFIESGLPEGFLAYNKETDKYYKFNSTNEDNDTLGKWKEYTTGGGHTHGNKDLLDTLINTGAGDKFLADDGKYKSVFVISNEAPTDTGVFWIDDTDATKLLLKIHKSDEDGWVTISAAGGDKITREDTTTVKVGGLDAGSSVKDKSVADILESILFPYQKPEVSISINPAATIYEIGATVSSITFSITATKKSKDITSIKIYDGTQLINTITDDVANGGTFSYTYSCNITTNTSLKVEVTDGTSTASAVEGIVFTNRSYYGFVANDATVDDVAVKALQNNSLKTTKALTYSGITCSFSKLVYAYPKSFGTLKSILDNNGFDYISSYECREVSIDSVDYYVYVMKDATTVDNFKQIYA